MEKLSGLVLDFYDDQNWEVLKAVYPTPGDVPNIIKQAHRLSEEERSALPDDSFALVLQEGEVTLRKYACIDPGNTLLSLAYFVKTGSRLPMGAQELVSRNLRTACAWYWPSSEELEKDAGIGSTLLGAAGKAGAGLVSGAVKNPLGALNKVMLGATAIGGAKQIANNFQNYRPIPGGI